MAEDGTKMSKSIGNVVSAIDAIDKYGSDALRMGIIAGRVPGVNRGYDNRKVEEARNFCNKLWNITRYIEGISETTAKQSETKPQTVADHWILNKLQQLQQGLERDFDHYRLAEAYERLYHFVWDDFADWYIEASKTEPNVPLLTEVLSIVLAYLHPFAPFVTETIWQTLEWTGDGVLAAQQWPAVPKADDKQARAFDDIQKIVTESRFITKTLNVVDATLYYTDVPFLTENAKLIKRLARLGDVTEVRNGTGLALTSTPHRCWLDIEPAAASHFLEQLAAQRSAQKDVVERLAKRLSNKAYLKHAPGAIVKQTKEQLAEAETRLKSIDHERERFQRLI